MVLDSDVEVTGFRSTLRLLHIAIIEQKQESIFCLVLDGTVWSVVLYRTQLPCGCKSWGLNSELAGWLLIHLVARQVWSGVTRWYIPWWVAKPKQAQVDAALVRNLSDKFSCVTCYHCLDLTLPSREVQNGYLRRSQLIETSSTINRYHTSFCLDGSRREDTATCSLVERPEGMVAHLTCNEQILHQSLCLFGAYPQLQGLQSLLYWITHAYDTSLSNTIIACFINMRSSVLRQSPLNDKSHEAVPFCSIL